jgi:hypothetical protein
VAAEDQGGFGAVAEEIYVTTMCWNRKLATCFLLGERGNRGLCLADGLDPNDASLQSPSSQFVRYRNKHELRIKERTEDDLVV